MQPVCVGRLAVPSPAFVGARATAKCTRSLFVSPRCENVASGSSSLPHATSSTRTAVVSGSAAAAAYGAVATQPEQQQQDVAQLLASLAGQQRQQGLQQDATAAHEGHAPGGNATRGGAAAGSVAAFTADDEEYVVVQRQALAGGQLDLVRLGGERLLRVWLPPGYSRVEAARHPYPLFVLNDGQNLFDDRLSFSGASWRAADAAAAAITTGQLPPFIVVGIDHAEALRSFEYLPYKPGIGPGGFRKDAASWPGGGVASYLAWVFDEILPWVQGQYGGATSPDRIAFGGSSFGGICTLYACMHYGDRFGAALVESPSLWFADEKFLREDLAQYSGPWPSRMYLAMGSREYGGTRPAEAAAGTASQWDRLLVGYCIQLARMLGEQGMDSSRLRWQIGLKQAHTESAWAQRLPGAMAFLLQPWWGDAAARHSSDLFFTSPRKLLAGQPGVLFVNKSRSHSLAGSRGLLSASIGFNNWTLGQGERQLQPAPQLDLSRPYPPLPAQQLPAQQQEATWQAVPFTVPDKAYEMNFVLTDGQGAWDNNAGHNFYVRVKLPAEGPAAAQSLDEALTAAKAAAEGRADEVASRSAQKLFFTTPEVLVAGAPARVYFNRAKSHALRWQPNVKVHLGFNHWELGGHQLQLRPSDLWRGEEVEWWATETFQVPEGVFDMSFAFTDGQDAWDNNEGHNYSMPVWRPAQQQDAPPRTIASSEVVDHAGGKMHVITLSKRAATDAASRESKWKEEKVLRVWTPPGYSREAAPAGGWPLLVMCDGKNMFEDWLAHQGVSWRLGDCAAGLIGEGMVPPFVVLAVDSAGPMRSLNYLPYKPGTGVGGFRGDAERWPGGGCEGYMRRLVQEILPLVTTTFGTATDPARVAFGGGSFAGVTALYAALHYPHVFGAVLAESPSLWIAEGRFLQDLWAHVSAKGPLPERLFIGCGTKEYSATRDHERPEIDQLLLDYYVEAARALEAGGMREGQRLRFLIEQDAGHHEAAWAWRLSGALQFLLSPWWDA